MASEKIALPYLQKDEVMGAFNKLLFAQLTGPADMQTPYAREMPRWRGRIAYKNPMDMWVYQELIYRTQPDIIIETGTARGGSALFLADMCALVNRGFVFSVDVKLYFDLPQHPRLAYIMGDSTGPEMKEFFANKLYPRKHANALQVMCILDSDHSHEHVLEEMRYYGSLVSVGCYMIVEDGNPLGIHPAENSAFGPMTAIQAFMAENDDFKINRSCERFLLTYNPNGYLLRVK